jgi:nitrate/TMAO reductase-like tetraheme cytochrome c subunit
MKDIWGNIVLDPSKIDWEERRMHRENFVYDSGCLSCHQKLDEATKGNMKAFLPHRDYFLGRADLTCVSCHENVGHKHLGLHLKKEE